LKLLLNEYQISSQEILTVGIISPYKEQVQYLTQLVEEDEDFKATFELIKKIKFINSYSFIFSPRPGTVAADLNLIDKKISMERLEKIQSQLYDNQMHMNKSLEHKTINVLVENLTEDKTGVFGRSEYMTSVIFDGKKEDIGKIVPVKINKSNRSTLFGEKDFNSNQKVA
jgi:tRNA-2-methylthio-N6-dimethylallyladenosine synthase